MNYANTLLIKNTEHDINSKEIDYYVSISFSRNVIKF